MKINHLAPGATARLSNAWSIPHLPAERPQHRRVYYRFTACVGKGSAASIFLCPPGKPLDKMSTR